MVSNYDAIPLFLCLNPAFGATKRYTGGYLTTVLPLRDNGVTAGGSAAFLGSCFNTRFLQRCEVILPFTVGSLAFLRATAEPLALEFLIAMLAGDIEALFAGPPWVSNFAQFALALIAGIAGVVPILTPHRAKAAV